jgi:transcriptional antiterminator RfaH
VLDGAFSSCPGLFEGMAERERIAILLDLLGRKVRVVLDADLVAAA